ncbi:para-aminobenzoate synthetase [Murinocardiopsis flavida]|uniref:aminodeoxychorismate synthase n=1 Tax=Murinocardiopsis flavida TaxID=645275 RepID=A0A2P8DNK2_9ACTN|nr:aminodeoxychorismate synthase component I [Murinocardiopsis flavida]PSK98779.1 para-aminobenzoate synthetase [Murinocardiopsis flavida]
MRVLLVDNHDSYTYNLFQLIASVLGAEPVVYTNDAPELGRLDSVGFDAIVVSPGPGRPQKPRDLGGVPRLLAGSPVPVLGVCLGHQAIAHLAGAPVVAADTPRHGHLSTVRHTGTGLFADVPPDFTAVRYHSLCVREPLPEDLRATAWAEDGVVMALEHRTLPRWGVQFHPESVAGEHGRTLVANFAALASRSRRAVTETRRTGHGGTASETMAHPPGSGQGTGDLGTDERAMSETPEAPPRPQYGRAGGGRDAPGPAAGFAAGGAVEVAGLPFAVDCERAFAHLYGAREYAFWLDSSRVAGPARFSFLGDASGPSGEVLTYRVGDGAVSVRPTGGAPLREDGTIFDALRRRLPGAAAATETGLPFDFAGGYVGYFGYELKADCGAAAAYTAETPDAVWLRCDRFVAVDHAENRTYAVAAGTGARAWADRTAAELRRLPPLPPLPSAQGAASDAVWEWERERDGYTSDVKECLGYLASGESYEICLTTRLRTAAPADDLAFYRRLRAASPAPYAALLRLGEVTVHSASPERFLRVGADGTAESRPIKGTAPRSADPAADAALAAELRASPKTRAENLMIVDLLRNDLGRVCAVGSVEVPDFMYVESYATVHQLVSTVRGRLRPGVGALDAVRACFPGGSMTGAPKLRTMEILDRLEGSPRGVYSGALGFLSHSGAADLSIVIRTAVRSGDTLTIGAGGAIVLASDPHEEYEEMLLKASVPAGAAGAVRCAPGPEPGCAADPQGA